MVRVIDLPPIKRVAIERYPTPEFGTEAWVVPRCERASATGLRRYRPQGEFFVAATGR